MPEQLQARGISWKVYTSPDNYLPAQIGDPIFQFFAQYYSKPELAQRAFVPQFPTDFIADARDGTLPAVAWIYTPVAQSDHPPAPPALGESAVEQIVAALVSNRDAWAHTALFVTWDENGGLFDHVTPPTPAPGTRGEHLTVVPSDAGGIAGPIGFGFRVPMLVVSPFARGGRICSETFDHTSILRFIEARFGAEVPYRSDWRRHTAGDLTSAFRFDSIDASVPALPVVSVGDVVTDGCAATLVDAETKLLPSGDYPVPPNSIPYQEPSSAPVAATGGASAHGRHTTPSRRRRRRMNRRRPRRRRGSKRRA